MNICYDYHMAAADMGRRVWLTNPNHCAIVAHSLHTGGPVAFDDKRNLTAEQILEGDPSLIPLYIQHSDGRVAYQRLWTPEANIDPYDLFCQKVMVKSLDTTVSPMWWVVYRVNEAQIPFRSAAYKAPTPAHAAHRAHLLAREKRGIVFYRGIVAARYDHDQD